MTEGKAKVLAIRVGYGIGLILGLAAVFFADLVTATNYATTLVAVGVVGLGLWEFYGLCERKGLRPWRAFGVGAGGVLVVAQWLDLRFPGVPVPLTLAVFVSVVVLLALLSLVRKSRTTILEDVSVTVFGLLYVWFLLMFLFRLRNEPSLTGSAGLWITCTVVATAKAGDIGAFFTGSFLGRHRLAPAISPNKTVEGAVGGLLASCLVAVVACRLIPSCADLFGLALSLALGVTVGVLSMAGDLFESLLKRAVHVKDSGSIIPEFGGMLDLLDGLLFCGPAAYYLVLLVR